MTRPKPAPAPSQEPAFRAGFAAILGRPNAGKSTLLNRLVGQKVAIVTSKPQTTRNRVQGFVNHPAGQIVLIDTPGLHKPDSALGSQMMKEVSAALEGIDVLLLVADATSEQPHVDTVLLDRARHFAGKTILVLNKVDAIAKSKLLPMIESMRKAFDFLAIVPVSALKGTGCDSLLTEILRYLPEHEPYFPEDQVTDQPERFLAAEIIREKAITLTYHEVPHALAVIVDKFEETPKLLRIQATLNVERDSQKKILIGHKGAMLKKIGTEARKELETLLDGRIFLGLYVKVAPHWRDNPQRVRELDWHFQLEGLSNSEEQDHYELNEAIDGNQRADGAEDETNADGHISDTDENTS